jgi:hypothetical protein
LKKFPFHLAVGTDLNGEVFCFAQNRLLIVLAFPFLVVRGLLMLLLETTLIILGTWIALGIVGSIAEPRDSRLEDGLGESRGRRLAAASPISH